MTLRSIPAPPAAVQRVTVEKTSNFTAENHGSYIATATLTVTDPSPVQAAEFTVWVRNGTATVGGTAYIAGQVIKRSYHSGAWSNTVEVALSAAQTFSALQTFSAGLTVSSGTTSLQTTTCTALTASSYVRTDKSAAGDFFIGYFSGSIKAQFETDGSGNPGFNLRNSGGTVFAYCYTDKFYYTASGVFGASALLASERLRVAGGTMGTPGATDVLLAAGRVYAGDTGTTSIQTSGGVTAAGRVVSTGTSGVGYATGAGGTVTQITSRSTGVTLNKTCGQITLVSAAGSTTPTTFTVTNSTVASTDVIVLNQDTGTDTYVLLVRNVGAGSFQITAYTTGGTTTETPVIGFAVIKGVAA